MIFINAVFDSHSALKFKVECIFDICHRGQFFVWDSNSSQNITKFLMILTMIKRARDKLTRPILPGSSEMISSVFIITLVDAF